MIKSATMKSDSLIPQTLWELPYAVSADYWSGDERESSCPLVLISVGQSLPWRILSPWYFWVVHAKKISTVSRTAALERSPEEVPGYTCVQLVGAWAGLTWAAMAGLSEVSLRGSAVMHRDVWYKLFKKETEGERKREWIRGTWMLLNLDWIYLVTLGIIVLLLIFCMPTITVFVTFLQGLSFRNPY